ncbi:MAG: RluA family pseudouridine synthase [Ruminococcus sp.]|nr:RluA family pseudouridine synthase [Ruminococcus sp.]
MWQQTRKMKQFFIQEKDSDQRLDRFLQKQFPHLPKSLPYKWIRTKHIKINKKRCAPDQRLQVGDEVTIFIADEMLGYGQTRREATPPQFLQASDQLNILFENAQILILCKPVGLVVHCDNRQTPDTLINRVLHYLYRTGEYDPSQEQSFTPALCNRLDRNTGGIVIAAKTAPALREMNRLIRENCVHKRYLCTTVGTPNPKSAVLDAWHKKSETHNTVTICDHQQVGFQKIRTGYRVIASNTRHALVSVQLITGRTHQIRAHLAHIGTPILGDNKYGNGKENRIAHCKYQQLWAYELTLETDPGTCLADIDQKIFRTEIPTFVRREFPSVSL